MAGEPKVEKNADNAAKVLARKEKNVTIGSEGVQERGRRQGPLTPPRRQKVNVDEGRREATSERARFMPSVRTSRHRSGRSPLRTA